MRPSLIDYISHHCEGAITLHPLPVDCSFRRYVRFDLDGVRSPFLVMDAPPEKEPIFPFCKISAHLRKAGFKAPEVGNADFKAGYCMVEDFGSDTFTRLLQSGTKENILYQKAAYLIAAMHLNPALKDIDLPFYDKTVLMKELAIFDHHFLREIAIGDTAPVINAFSQALDAVAAKRDTLVLRDFHVDNLMLIKGETPQQQIGLLDFQDALIGSEAYDIVSLLEDARRDVSQNAKTVFWSTYQSETGKTDQEMDDLQQDCLLLGAQRSAKILGIFLRQFRLMGRSDYLQHLPRTADLLATALKAPPLVSVGQALQQVAPDWQQFADKAALFSNA